MKLPTYQETWGSVGRWRRALRRRVLEPILVGHRSFRETVLNALAARGHLILCRNGNNSFFVDPSDRGIGAALMWLGQWQRGELERALAHIGGRLPPGAVFVDVGANIGTHTVYAMRSGLFARAVAFEPEPRSGQLLQMNLAINKLDDRVVVVDKAAGERAGRAVLHLHPRNKANNMIGERPSLDGLESMEVAVVRLDQALAEVAVAPEQVGLVLIDVEGYEPEAVGGLGALVERAVPLVLEYAPERYTDGRRDALIALLTKHYSYLLNLSDPDSSRQPVTAIADIRGRYTDILVT